MSVLTATNRAAKPAANLAVGDVIYERGKVLLTVTKIERRKCGVHVNDKFCFNVSAVDVEVGA